MTIGVHKWAGKGSQSFLNAWSQYQYDTQRSCDILGQTSTAMSKLAGSIEDNVTAIRNAQAASTVGFIATGALVIVDIAQLGLDPLTDAATVGAASEDTALVEQAQTAEEEISQADSQISVELQEITSQIENSSMTGSVEMPIEDDAVVSDDTTTEFFQKGSESGSTITSIGQYYLKLIENKGVLVADDPDTQAYMKSNLAKGSTWFTGTDGDAGPHTTTVLLGENANDAAVYEEYLHVERGEERGWLGITEPDSIKEEIEVETEVLSKADKLNMTQEERVALQNTINGYRSKLWRLYGEKMP